APVIIAGSAGSSATFSEAQSNATSTQSETFKVDTVDNYVVATLAEKFRRASRSDAGAFMNGAKTVLDVHMRQWSNRHAQGLFRTGTGTIGRIESGKSTGILVLSNRTDARFFSRDMKLEAYTGDGTGSKRAGAGYVIAVDAAAGIVTVSATNGGSAGQPSEWDDGDYLVQSGDRNLRMSGLLAWLPIDRTGLGTPFHGVTRSVDPQKLAG